VSVAVGGNGDDADPGLETDAMTKVTLRRQTLRLVEHGRKLLQEGIQEVVVTCLQHRQCRPWRCINAAPHHALAVASERKSVSREILEYGTEAAQPLNAQHHIVVTGGGGA
jgi:hypothetical protein